jgi:hypothetical protein
MAEKSPRISAGASGLGSKVSKWLAAVHPNRDAALGLALALMLERLLRLLELEAETLTGPPRKAEAERAVATENMRGGSSGRAGASQAGGVS